MIRRAAIALALCAPPASAQSVEEAARANMALATDLCAQSMLTRTAPVQLFPPVGFTYSTIDRGTNSYGVDLGLDHYFHAPADTVKVQTEEPSTFGGTCYVLSTRLDQTTARGVVGAALSRRYPGTERDANGGWIIRGVSELPMFVTVRTIERHRYEPAGTVQISMGFPG